MVAGPGLAEPSHPFGLRVAYGWTNRGPTDYDHHGQPQKCPSLEGMAPSFKELSDMKNGLEDYRQTNLRECKENIL